MSENRVSRAKVFTSDFHARTLFLLKDLSLGDSPSEVEEPGLTLGAGEEDSPPRQPQDGGGDLGDGRAEVRYVLCCPVLGSIFLCSAGFS